MVSAILIGIAFAVASPELSRQDQARYEAAKQQAGRDPQEHIKLALWCEAHGLKPERMKHLAIAVLVDPKNSMARGLMGLVDFQGKWERPENVTAIAKEFDGADTTLAEYNGRRARMKNTPDAHWKLGLWCEEKGLEAEAQAHFTAVTRLDPDREAAWKRLGCKKQGNRWVTESRLAAERAEHEIQAKADRAWKPVLKKWRDALEQPRKRVVAEAALAEITDPRAVPMLWATFAPGGAAGQLVLARTLGQIDSARASRTLAVLAVFSPFGEVRKLATELLRRRDAREYAALLIGLLQDPIKYEVRPVNGPGSTGVLFVEGKEFNLQRLYAPPSRGPVVVPYRPDYTPGMDASGMPVLFYTEVSDRADRFVLGYNGRNSGVQAIRGLAQYEGVIGAALYAQTAQRIRHNMATDPLHGDSGYIISGAHHHFTTRYYEIPVGQMAVAAQQQAAVTAAVAEEKLKNDTKELDTFNSSVAASNDRIARLLTDATGAPVPPDRESWTAWFYDQLGYRYAPPASKPRPTVVEDVPLPVATPTVFAPLSAGVTTSSSVECIAMRFSCFAAGTEVWTLDGRRAIETLQVGDRLLTQDVTTGALGYHPVTAVHHNPPSNTIKLTLSGETVVSSTFHRFWKVGTGWVMARDLVVGDKLRTVGGVVNLEKADAGTVQPVFNLDVAGDADFFVGRTGALVHDNSLPGLRLAPFDSVPTALAKE